MFLVIPNRLIAIQRTRVIMLRLVVRESFVPPYQIIYKSFTQKLFEFDENTFSSRLPKKPLISFPTCKMRMPGQSSTAERPIDLCIVCKDSYRNLFYFYFSSHSASELFPNPKENRSLRNFQSWIRLIPSVLRPDK